MLIANLLAIAKPLKQPSVSHSGTCNSFVIPRSIDHQTLLSMEFSREEYWSGLPLPSPKWGLKTPQTSLQENKLTSQAAPHFPSVVLVTQSCPTLCDPMDDACKAPLSMEFSRQKYWSGLPFPSPRDLSNPGIKSRPPTLQADSLLSEPLGKPLTINQL